MSEEIKPRKVQANCDLCRREDLEVEVKVTTTGEIFLLCGRCIKFLEELFTILDVKWSEKWY